MRVGFLLSIFFIVSFPPFLRGLPEIHRFINVNWTRCVAFRCRCRVDAVAVYGNEITMNEERCSGRLFVEFEPLEIV